MLSGASISSCITFANFADISPMMFLTAMRWPATAALQTLSLTFAEYVYI